MISSKVMVIKNSSKIKITPFIGLGWSMAIVSSFIAITYLVVIGWSLMYLYYSVLSSEIIWKSCINLWNNNSSNSKN